MKFEDFPPEEFSWTEKPVIGLCLMNAQKDSHGNPIDGMKFYEVGKHIHSGMIVIKATDRNMKHEYINDTYKKNGRFN